MAGGEGPDGGRTCKNSRPPARSPLDLDLRQRQHDGSDDGGSCQHPQLGEDLLGRWAQAARQVGSRMRMPDASADK